MVKESEKEKKVPLEKRIYLAKKKIFPQLEVVVDILINLEDSIKKSCQADGINHEFLLEWVFSELPCVSYEKPAADLDEAEVEEEEVEDE